MRGGREGEERVKEGSNVWVVDMHIVITSLVIAYVALAHAVALGSPHRISSTWPSSSSCMMACSWHRSAGACGTHSTWLTVQPDPSVSASWSVLLGTGNRCNKTRNVLPNEGGQRDVPTTHFC